MILNLGSGTNNRVAGEVALDINVKCAPDVVGNAECLPFKDEVFDEIRATHVLEHVKDIVAVMNECDRVLKKGGRFHIRVPLFPTAASVADPTHCRYFISDTFDYFCREGAMPSLRNRWHKGGLRVTDWEIYCTLRKAP